MIKTPKLNCNHFANRLPGQGLASKRPEHVGRAAWDAPRNPARVRSLSYCGAMCCVAGPPPARSRKGFCWRPIGPAERAIVQQGGPLWCGRPACLRGQRPFPRSGRVCRASPAGPRRQGHRRRPPALGCRRRLARGVPADLVVLEGPVGETVVPARGASLAEWVRAVLVGLVVRRARERRWIGLGLVPSSGSAAASAAAR